MTHTKDRFAPAVPGSWAIRDRAPEAGSQQGSAAAGQCE